MRKTLLVIFFLQFLFTLNAQSIIVNSAGDAETNLTAEQLLTNVLLDGGLCSSTSNFQLKDNPSAQFPSANRSWGYFKKGNSNFPFERGIVLTSGFARNAQGPTGGIVSDGEYDWGGDSQASYLAGTSTNNATVFEFDFVPQGNFISFNYIFASEEYPNWACSEYNDVFAFIISGPGINNDPGINGKNIARLPNGLPVTINNVNDQSCGDDTYYVGGPFNDIQYGGRTIPMVAQSPVIPGQTYHIRLLIADATDTQYDSAVFLEAGSFNLGSTIVDGNGGDLGDELMVCGTDEFTLKVNVTDPEVQLQWYKDGVAIPGATTNTLIITESGVYKISVISGDCSAEDEINVLFGELQTNGVSFSLEKIDYNGDGIENFNLPLVQPQIVDNPAVHTFKYYPTLADAENQTNQITNATNYPATDNTLVYCRVSNADGCSKIVNILLKVVEDCINPEAACPGPEFGLNIPFQNDGEIPSTAPSGPNYGCLGSQPYPRFYYFKIDQPGNLYFDMNQYTQENQEGDDLDVDFIVWGPFTEVPCDYSDLQQVVDCSFSASSFEYVSIENAQAGEIYIMMITNYAGSYGQFGYVNLIFDEENSTGTFDCSIIEGNVEYAQCDDDQDGQVVFDLAAIGTELLENNPTHTFKFYSTEQDAIDDTNNNLIPTGNFTVNVVNAPVVIYAQIKDGNGEVIKVIEVTLNVYEGVTGAQNVDVSYCDAGLDGVETINLTTIQVIANPNQYNITYYETLADAQAGNAAFIPNPTAYVTGSGTVYVRIQNENGCYAIAEINITITGLEVDLGDNFAMCEGEFTLTATADLNGYTGITYTWYRNNVLLDGEIESTLIINQTGTYKVVVETAEGCSGEDTVVVSQGEAPTITNVIVGPNSVIIEATGGATPYEYSMTGYVWQSSNQFNNLQPGIHTVYVKSAEGCIVTEQLAIFKIPTMFTPNGDGINDTWNIPGLEIYEGSNVVIYDRSGRMVYEAELNSNVIWNGYFKNGQKAPTQDYWYIINVSDGRKFTGHVTVKSRGEKN
jgi:gliding motility-associated-like protein